MPVNIKVLYITRYNKEFILDKPDIHIDLEKEGIGYLIEPYDVKTWKEKIIYLKQHPEVIEEMSKQAKKLTEKEYNAKTTASYIVNDFIQIAK
mgnify:CR=1 FL=1